MSESEFTRLFKYVQEMRQEMNERFDTQDKRFDDVYGAIAELSAQVRDYHREMIILTHQVDRMRDAIKQIARETGVKLSVEL